MTQLTALLLAALAADPYEQYVKTSRDFQPVKQSPEVAAKAWPSWTYMPWTFKWTIGYTDASAKWSLEHGYNGAFINADYLGTPESKTGKLDWINAHGLRFYLDHAAGKGDLHLWDGDKFDAHKDEVHGTGMRPRPLNEAMRQKLHKTLAAYIGNVKGSPNRAAYALDDEISWGHFVHPTMWQITDEPGAYQAWLREVYGEHPPEHKGWISYADVLPKLKTWTIGTFDASQLMDQWTFNDSYWCNFVGELVDYANSLDAATPMGFDGAQAPNAFGGYDYAKLMRKIRFIEAYNLGSSQAIIRSFNPRNQLPVVSSHFHKSAADTIWQTWYYLAHGNKGMIGWVDKWFDESGKPLAWHDEVAPTMREAAEKIGPRMSGATWRHDGVAIYYSHASIQLSWIMDAEAHRQTWVNRNNDHYLGSSHNVRKAWENMLRDEGLQYSFISYVDVIQHGVPAEYRVLILPAVMCLSDVEAQRIREFVARGGTVIADYLPGVWDQHGKGRANGGVIDDLFGVKHDPKLKASDIFGEKLWCETDQDANYGRQPPYEQLLTKANTSIKEESGFDKCVRRMRTEQVKDHGRGHAILLNLSPQWYNAYRVRGFEDAKRRQTFMHYVTQAVGPRWVRIEGAGEREFGHEITYWDSGERTIAFVCFNPEVRGSETGGGNAAGLKTDTLPITLALERGIKNVRDERTGKPLPDGRSFRFDWKMNEAIVISFDQPR